MKPKYLKSTQISVEEARAFKDLLEEADEQSKIITELITRLACMRSLGVRRYWDKYAKQLGYESVTDANNHNLTLHLDWKTNIVTTKSTEI